METRRLFVRSLVFFSLFTASVGFGDGEAEEPIGPRNIRLPHRAEGMYLAPRSTADNPEQQGFSTTLEPLAPLSIEEMQDYIKNHPELAGYKVIIIGPPVSGPQAGKFKEAAEATLKEAGITNSPVQVIRHPKTLKEKIFNILPRREDYESPIVAELKVAAFKILVAESLSFTVLLAPPILQANNVDLGPWLDSIVDKIALPMGTAVAMCVMDITNMVPLISFRRFLSNHNIRLSPQGSFLRQFLMSMYFSTGFYMVANNSAIREAWDQMTWAQMPTDLASATVEMSKVIIPASIFNMAARTTVGTSLNIWEHRGPNRRFWTSVMEALTGIMIAPVYILSTLPGDVLTPIIDNQFMDLNPAHLAMLTIGGAGGIAWTKMKIPAVSNFVDGCVNMLRNFGARALGKASPKIPSISSKPDYSDDYVDID